MPRAIYPTLFKKYPDFGSFSDEERERLLEEERQRYEGEIAAELPGQDPEEELRAALPEEEFPVTAGLGVQEEDMPIDPTTGLPETLGAFTQADVGAPVSDEQALRWEEERRIYDAPYKISSELRKGRDYKQELIDKQFEGVDPNVRDVKKHASSEMSEAKKQFEEILGRPPNTPEERLASFNFQQKAKEEAYKQKQDDIAALNDAVSKYNTEQVIPRVKFIQGEAAMLQKKHAEQGQAEIEALGTIEAERAKGPKAPKEPAPVTWTTATKQVSRRFGKEDPMGNIIITPELAGMNRIAQKKLVELKKRGNVEPLDAVNQAEEFARNVERKYWEYVDAAANEEERKEIRKEFKAKYKYVPRIRQR